jgi:hypothetical protein
MSKTNVLTATEAFDKSLTTPERQIMAGLTTPNKIQTFLDEIAYSSEAIYRCPLRVLRERVGDCFDGALFAAADATPGTGPAACAPGTRQLSDHCRALK